MNSKTARQNHIKLCTQLCTSLTEEIKHKFSPIHEIETERERQTDRERKEEIKMY